MNSNNEEDIKKYETKKYWLNRLEDMRLEANRQFDKQIVYISGGGLVFSIAFLKDILGADSVPKLKCLLIAAWISFTISLIMNLLSFKTASNSFDYMMLEDESLMNRFNKITTILNCLSIIGLVVGLISFVIFVIVNF